MTRAIIYDMDGVIIDTIPYGKRAEHALFAHHGITIHEYMYEDTMGFREDETIAHWCAKYGWGHLDQQQLLKEYFELYVRDVSLHGDLMPGVRESIEYFKSRGLPLALASSSYEVQINTVLKKFKLAHYFDVVHSAEHEEYGKPHPSVYTSAAEQLGVQPHMCAAIEDSVNGIQAAKSAGMKCICIPRPEEDISRFSQADMMLTSLNEVDDRIWAKNGGIL